MKILYVDTPMGVSGDMFLAALIDLGVDLRLIKDALKKLPLGDDEYTIRAGRAKRHSISARTFKVRYAQAERHRTFRDISGMIKKSGLKKTVADLSVAIFRTIAEAEAKVHGTVPEKVHFHEVGAVDSIVDIVGAATAVDSLGMDRLVSSPIPLGTGLTRTMHGVLPVPAPATLEILKGVPVAASTAPFELTTPTGAAIVKTLASAFGGMPAMTVEAAGYGAGKKDFKDAANVLRLVLGSSPGTVSHGKPCGEKIYVLETNIDDMSPQITGYLMEKLLSAGALDVYVSPVQMKKSRPGALLTVLAEEDRRARLLDLIFAESTSIGVRTHAVERHCLERKTVRVPTGYGTVRVKVSERDGRVLNAHPEYEDCREIARRRSVPLKEVMAAAAAAYRRRRSGSK